jgi:hypothetical protein
LETVLGKERQERRKVQELWNAVYVRTNVLVEEDR